MEFLGVSLAAWMSILALTIVIIISCVNEELHVGLLSIASRSSWGPSSWT